MIVRVYSKSAWPYSTTLSSRKVNSLLGMSVFCVNGAIWRSTVGTVSISPWIAMKVNALIKKSISVITNNVAIVSGSLVIERTDDKIGAVK